MDTLLAIVFYGGTLILVVMGGVVSVSAPQQGEHRAKWVWIISFAVIGVLIISAQIWSEARDREAREEFEVRLTGGANFCYFRADLSKRKNNGYQWVLENKELRIIPTVKMCIYKVAENGNLKFQSCLKEADFCLPHSIVQAGSLTAGKYHFEFFSSNSWQESLDISETERVVTQRITILREGKEIWSDTTSRKLEVQPNVTR